MARRLPLLLSVFFLIQFSVFSDSLTERLDTISLFGSGKNLSFIISMEITGGRGTKSRTIEAFIQRDEKVSNILLQVTEPVFLRKMKFLQQKDSKGRETIWMGTSSGIRRVSGRNSSERVFDSDFTVEDFSSVNSENYSFTELTPDLSGGLRRDRIVCELLDTGGTAISKKKLYIDPDTDMLLQVDFLDTSDTLVKQYQVLETQYIDGKPFPKICRMETIGSNSHTVLSILEIDPATPIPDRKFNPGNL